jgi:plasmid stabilization system protein ParE
MTDVTIAPIAQAEIEEIVDFIAVDSGAAAERVGAAISQAIARIGEWPGIGHSREDLTSRPLRFWNVMGRYTIVYEGDQRAVRILRVFGPGRDITQHL